MKISTYANPKKFYELNKKILPYLTVIGAPIYCWGLVWGMFFSPADYQQGEAVRIMYVHVPASWLALMLYAFVSMANGIGLVWKHPLAHTAAYAAAPVGLCFTLVSLLTGSIWGKPMWGTWWVWDARLTSMLVLAFLYAGYIALHEAFDDRERGIMFSSVLSLLGLVNLPIIKWSVNWWNTMHQPASITKFSSPSIHSSILMPLLICTAGASLLAAIVVLIRMQTAYLEQKKIKLLK